MEGNGEKRERKINNKKNYDKICHLRRGGGIYFPPICTVPTWGKEYNFGREGVHPPSEIIFFLLLRIIEKVGIKVATFAYWVYFPACNMFRFEFTTWVYSLAKILAFPPSR